MSGPVVRTKYFRLAIICALGWTTLFVGLREFVSGPLFWLLWVLFCILLFCLGEMFSWWWDVENLD